MTSHPTPLASRRFAFEDRPTELLARAFAPQRTWYETARKAAMGKGRKAAKAANAATVALVVVRDAAEAAFGASASGSGANSAESISNTSLPASPSPTGGDERVSGEAHLRLLFALGEAHAPCSAALEAPGLEAFVATCDRLLREAVPPLLEDATLRLLARLLDVPGNDALFELATARFHARVAFVASEEGFDPWCREAALRVLATLEPADFHGALEAILADTKPGPGFFLRARMVRDVLPLATDPEALERLREAACADPSETVRLAAVESLPPDHALLRRLACEDPAERVRAAVLFRLSSPVLCQDSHGLGRFLSIAAERARDEADPYALRVLASGVRAVVTRTILSPEASPARESLWARLSASHRAGELAAILPALLSHRRAKAAVARDAHLARQALLCIEDPSRAHAARTLVTFARRIPAGGSRRLPKAISARFRSIDEIARVLTLVAADDHGFDIVPAAPGGAHVIARGHAFGFRLWRLVHEMRTPSSDKRQAFPHTIGRLFEGRVHVPSQVLCELAQTKVPGEPLYLPDEDGWRPAVPLPDEFVSLVFRSAPLAIVVPEGRTVVTPPRGIAAKARAWAKLTAGFAAFAHARNWTEGSQAPAGEYVEMARGLGFEVRFEPDDPRSSTPLVRFFRGSAGAGLDTGSRLVGAAATARGLADPVTVVTGAASVHATWGAFQRFVANSNTNTLGELLLFVTALVAFFAGSHLWKHARFRRARSSLPLVIGGWGTRGKSGTERLKAALFSSMGFGVVSKTTGCEAQLLVAAPFGTLKEIPLYRPYDKATIWEQQNVVEFASALGVNVFLWECMGLTPDYVRILQRSWMRDDLSTLTNTYPDHEDLQGPAGVNIPQVMTNFIPAGTVLCTTEEQMLPFLREAAVSRGTGVRAAGWLQAGLIPGEVLSAFPYEEHPYNVALVLEVAGACGIEPLFALKSMGEKVVPDIGVLKTYPTVEGHGRSFAFSNGCSANERHGCQSNWTRLSFDAPQSRRTAGTWVSAFVNNRADRVARSQVFARMMVRDLSVDRYYLVGSNLTGLMGFVRSALAEFLEEIDLWREGEASPTPAPDAGVAASASAESPTGAGQAASWGDSAGGVDPLGRLVLRFEHLRLAHDAELVEDELAVMLRSCGLRGEELDSLSKGWAQPEALASDLASRGVPSHDVAALLDALAVRVAQLRAFEGFARSISELGGAKAPSTEARRLNLSVREYLRETLMAKMVHVDDKAQEDGDAMADVLLRTAPPGFHQRVMGIQNIKGPGLTLIYRLEIWADLVKQVGLAHGASSRLRLREILQRLDAHPEIPVFARAPLARQLGSLAGAESLGSEEHALLEGVLAQCRTAGEHPSGGMAPGGESALGFGTMAKSSGRGAFKTLAHPFVEFFEPLAAVVRRRRADRIYRTLAEGRLTPAEAALELRRLTV